MEEQTKKDITSWAIHFWYVIVILVMGVALLFIWNRWGAQKAENDTLRAGVMMNQTITEIEQRLIEVHNRELEYEKINIEQGKLKTTLAGLEKQRKELEKKKKETLKNEIEKMDSTALSNTFNSMGIPNTITGSK
jgi:predicted negative regulator of RcsB-dependent stress response